MFKFWIESEKQDTNKKLKQQLDWKSSATEQHIGLGRT